MVILYSITIDKVGKSKHNNTLLRYKESKDRQNVSAETCCLSFDSL